MMAAGQNASTISAAVPLVVHVIYRFECGGLQTLLAECINRMPAHRYRHAVVCLAGYTDYAQRISKPGVEFYSLDKPPGAGLSSHVKLWKLLRRLRPAVLHTYNVSTIEYNATAFLAGVPVRIHAEHGHDSVEVGGKHAKYNLLRRLLTPVISSFVPVSEDLRHWLREQIGVPDRKIAMVPNGVDTVGFTSDPLHIEPALQTAIPRILIGTIGRIDRIKNHLGLLDAFSLLLKRFPRQELDLRLAIIGDGPLLEQVRARVEAEGLAERVWLPGSRRDIADLLRTFSVFVLPSVSEATPVTILEAMATGLPVVATRVGGVPQLVLHQQTGLLVKPSDPEALADALSVYISDAQIRARHGAAGRAHVEARYSVDAMVAGYEALYNRHLVAEASD
jgi:sugar transferase (PEP-CTERM/EpsH1 system associated)